MYVYGQVMCVDECAKWLYDPFEPASTPAPWPRFGDAGEGEGEGEGEGFKHLRLSMSHLLLSKAGFVPRFFDDEDEDEDEDEDGGEGENVNV